MKALENGKTNFISYTNQLQGFKGFAELSQLFEDYNNQHNYLRNKLP